MTTLRFKAEILSRWEANKERYYKEQLVTMMVSNDYEEESQAEIISYEDVPLPVEEEKDGNK